MIKCIQQKVIEMLDVLTSPSVWILHYSYSKAWDDIIMDNIHLVTKVDSTYNIQINDCIWIATNDYCRNWNDKNSVYYKYFHRVPKRSTILKLKRLYKRLRRDD